MRSIQEIKLIYETGEELLPGFSQDFPYIASRAELEKYIEPAVPWHWHRTVELFYMESGTLEYATPNGKWVFPAGSGGFVNSNVLHSSKVIPSENAAIQLLHLFEPELLSGRQLERIEGKYIRPLTTESGIEMIALFPDDTQQNVILKKIRSAFDLNEESWGYEFVLRQQLTDIWLDLLNIVRPSMESASPNNYANEKLKTMMRYIHTHFSETISVDQLAREAHISKRVCFRLFRENLHISPLEYMTEYRLRKAYQQLVETDTPITQIAYNSGLGSSSYFGKVFKAHFNCSPAQFRKEWHDRDNNTHK